MMLCSTAVNPKFNGNHRAWYGTIEDARALRADPNTCVRMDTDDVTESSGQQNNGVSLILGFSIFYVINLIQRIFRLF